MAPRTRLALFVAVVVAVGVAVLVLRPVDRESARDLLGGYGVPGFIVLGALLATAFVPGAVLSAAAGLLFGPGVGFLAAMGSALLTAVITVSLARGVARPGVEQLEDRRVKLVEDVVRRRPIPGVVLARLLPSVPDAPCSYVFGLAGLAVWQVLAGTIIGSAPRAFSYAVLGDAAGDRDGAQAVFGAVVLVLTGVLGAGLGWLAYRDVRPSARQGNP